MPKLKTKSICKRKFRITGTGKLTYKAIGKRHNMSKRSNKQVRQKRKTQFLSETNSKYMLKRFLSYFKKLRKTL